MRASRLYIQMVKRSREGQARRRVMHVCEIWTGLDWSGAGLFVETDEGTIYITQLCGLFSPFF